MTRQDIRIIMLKCIELRTTEDHPWNYVSDKIKQCWNEYEYCCNNQCVTPFWMWQFDYHNQTKLLNMLNCSQQYAIRQANEKWELKWEDAEQQIECSYCKKIYPDSLVIEYNWNPMCDFCFELLKERSIIY